MLMVILGILAGNIAYAQPPKPSPRNVVKLNPLSLFVATLNVQAERRIGDRFSVQLGANAGAPALDIYAKMLPAPIHYKFVGLTPELRYYLSFEKRQVPNGPYLGAYLRFQRVQKRYGIQAYDPDSLQDRPIEVRVSHNVLAGGFLVGYQFIFKNHLILDLFIGPRYGRATSKYQTLCEGCDGDERTAAKPGIHYSGIDLRAGIAFGYGF